MRSSSTGCAGSGQGNETAAYGDFLRNKIRLAPVSGLQVNADEVNPILKDHQRDIVVWAVRGGKRAVFAAFGLGKSVIQIEVLRLICEKTAGRGLIVLPLGVRQEFRRDGEMLGVDIKFIRRIEEAGETGLYMTNYETVRDGNLDPNEFTAVSLDEASVLRSYGSKTYQTFLSLFEGVRYRFVATATPSPNRYKELIHYAGFLGIMDTGQALTRFFQRDSTQANNLTLYPHKEREFWLWLNSWAIFLQRPSDLGYSDEGYSLPPFDVIYHEVQSNIADGGVDRDGQAALFRDTAVGVVSASKEKRETLEARIAKMSEILAAAPADHFIIWHDLEDERRAIEKAVPTAVSVYGTQELDEREQAIIDFSNGAFQYLAAKPVIAGSGCNFQRHCHKAIFLGIGFKFNDFIQALHRIYRFLQTHQVEIHIIYAESEREVLRTLQGKWEAHNRMVENMSEIIREHGLDKLSAAEVLTRSIGVERIEAKGEGWLVANNDCVDETRSMPDNSVDLIVTSIPFSNHYEYTPSYNDFGHTDSDDHFFQQMDFLTPELLRTLKPGRIYACHVKDRILFGNVTGMGMPTVNPFHARTIFHTMSHGFAYMGMVQINTDVVRENNQTYRLGWTENCKDGTKMGVGSPEYLLLFRKLPSDTSKAYADERVTKDKEDYTRARWQVDAHAFWRSSGDRLLTPDELAALGPDLLAKTFTEWSMKNVYDYETHIKIGEALEMRGALPSTFMSLAPGSTSVWTWHDVVRMRTLNGEQTKKGLENHICPLQFDIVDRVIRRFSNEGDLVFDPFGGLFTVPYRALKLGRRGRASELNPGYFLDGIKYLQAMEREISTPTMFDIFERQEEAA
ncbi:DNA methyltransferase [Sinorhizobium meliloti]|uniref:DNA methyltransferase n=1 Tax=Rhizobium meliloti TaxID=382 RepID=UPI0002861543|nr:DNA methyltransferase [Sinorhizobium meliloti]ASP79639.1 DNA methylase N-4 [Sinorhizobium meliloti]MQW17341.1 DNA methylase N-4 [Sinorhizobium meliloti]CCM66782.1 DNA/RNA helicase [Sinorhizobium meliloti Rm41]